MIRIVNTNILFIIFLPTISAIDEALPGRLIILQ